MCWYKINNFSNNLLWCFMLRQTWQFYTIQALFYTFFCCLCYLLHGVVFVTDPQMPYLAQIVFLQLLVEIFLHFFKSFLFPSQIMLLSEHSLTVWVYGSTISFFREVKFVLGFYLVIYLASILTAKESWPCVSKFIVVTDCLGKYGCCLDVLKSKLSALVF